MVIAPKISIITPSFNQGAFIEQTIKSVIGQQYPNFEYIIIDGGSTDATIEIIKKYEQHITYWISEKDSGQSEAINKGLQVASGDIVNWLNSDDYYEPGALHSISAAFQNPNVQVVTGKSRIFQQDNSLDRFSRGTDVYEGNLAKTIGWARIDQPETFFRKTAIDKIGYVNPSLHYVMDKEWWIRFLLKFGLSGFRKIDDVLANFRVHDQSKTGTQLKKFEAETDSLFFDLATICDAESEKKILNMLTEGNRQGFLFPKENRVDKRLVLASLHYYLLHKADLLYYRHERALAELCLNIIDEKFLHQEDRALLRKLNFRNKFYPVALAKLNRR